jgi:glycosyltransferase involved in cell wall biosynthesis
MNKTPILFTTFNRLDYTKVSLPALLERTPNGRVIVIDNGSTDGTVEYLLSYQHNFELILNGTNLGLAGAMNQFFDMTGNDQVAAKVDNDTVVPARWLETMLLALKLKSFDILQANHAIVNKRFNSFAELKAASNIKTSVVGDIVVRNAVGGSGVVFRRGIIKGNLPTDKGLNPWWYFQTDNPGLRKGFVENVWVDLLDMDGFNRCKKDVDTGYAKDVGRVLSWVESETLERVV